MNANIHSYDNWSTFEARSTIHKEASLFKMAKEGRVDELKDLIQDVLEQTDYECLDDGSYEASFNIRSKQGNTPLIAAVNNNQYEMAKTLILNGADVNATNKEGETALMKAESLHNDQMTQLIIENGAQIKV